MVSVDRLVNGCWTELGSGRTVAGVIHRVCGRRYAYQRDAGTPGYGLLLRPCPGGGWNVVARVRWTGEKRSRPRRGEGFEEAMAELRLSQRGRIDALPEEETR